MEKGITKILPAVLLLALAAVLIFCPVSETDADTQKLPPVIKEDMSMDGDFSLMKDTVIETGGSLTVAGSLDLEGKRLTVMGKLVLKEGAKLTDSGKTGRVVMEGPGSAEMVGTVGEGNAVRFSSSAGEADVCQVSGLRLSVTVYSDKDTLTVGGSLSSVSENTVFRTSDVMFGDVCMNDLKDRKADTNSVLLDGRAVGGSTVHVNGQTVAAVKTLRLLSGSELVIEGTVYSPVGKDAKGYVELKTGSKADVRSFSTYVEDQGFDRTKVPVFVSQTGIESSIYGLTYSSVSLINLPGIVLEAVTKETSDGTEQRFAITGVSLSGVRPVLAVQPELVYTGTVTVPEGVSAEFPDDARLTSASGGLIDVRGMMKTFNPVKDYKGTMYRDGRTYCYTDFETALGSGATELTVRGGLSFDGDYVLGNGTKLYLDQELAEKEQPRYVIPEGCTFTVGAGASVGPEINFTHIEGTLKVSMDGDCVPTSDAYADSWMTDGYRVYSGQPEPEGTSIFTYLAAAVVLAGGLGLGILVFRRNH